MEKPNKDSLFVRLTMQKMAAIHSKSEKEAPTSYSVIHRTARYTSTPSSHLPWAILLVVVTKTAWTALLLNAALDRHAESISNLTILSTQWTQRQELLELYLLFLTLSNSWKRWAICTGDFPYIKKGIPFETLNLQSALCLIHNSRVFLEENEQAIYHDVNTHLPKTLNGPQGNVAGKTIDSLRLVEWGLNRLNEVTKQFSYYETNLLSFMTLDVEHFHSTIHV